MKKPPQNIEYEQSVMATLLVWPEKAPEIFSVFSADDFYKAAHREIYKEALVLHESKQPIGLAEIATALNTAGKLDVSGGASYIAELADLPIISDVEHYHRELRHKAVLRAAISTAQHIVAECSETIDAVETIDRAQQAILQLNFGGLQNSIVSLKSQIDPAVERYEDLHRNKGKITGVPTGFVGIDRDMGGLQNTDLIILAARPGMGKTGLAVNGFAKNAAKRGYPVGVFSLEMSKQQIINRLFAGATGVNALKFRSGMFSREDWERIVDGADSLSRLPIFFDDTHGLTCAEIRQRARVMVSQHKCRLIVIDQLNFIAVKGRSRNEEVGEISRAMKGLAKELDVPLVLITQLNRKLEDRSNKRPLLSDLRDSGNLEQDADSVIFIYRDDYYRTADAHGRIEYDGKAEIILAKQRNGPTGSFDAVYSPETTTFHNPRQTEA